MSVGKNDDRAGSSPSSIKEEELHVGWIGPTHTNGHQRWFCCTFNCGLSIFELRIIKKCFILGQIDTMVLQPQRTHWSIGKFKTYIWITGFIIKDYIRRDIKSLCLMLLFWNDLSHAIALPCHGIAMWWWHCHCQAIIPPKLRIQVHAPATMIIWTTGAN